ncbi:hypothetical protein EI42_00486 [Thermosporothrix hazakensis]|uniref:Uncharacterized protein n=1 Tax=Thermosporothrix hazakensis TaxID=644383 RepID=A0A326UCG7_THEHA|nr:hypothetical protein EI42_00486 [Thermosporothrix hazakensis]
MLDEPFKDWSVSSNTVSIRCFTTASRIDTPPYLFKGARYMPIGLNLKELEKISEKMKL